MVTPSPLKKKICGGTALMEMITPIDKYQTKLKSRLQEKQQMTDEEILEEITQIEMKPSLLVMSGGLDTTTLLYMLRRELIPLEVLSFDYGQEATKEIEIAHKNCSHLRVKQHIIKISEKYIDGNLAKGGDKFHDDATLIPNRNSIFLSLAVSYALQHGFERVYYGATAFSDPSYCDCQPIYVHYFNMLNMVSDLREVQIRAPLLTKTKTEIIDLALELGVDLKQTWSCYNNTENPCGICSSCKVRKGFEQEYRNNLNQKLRKINNMLNHYEY